MKNLKELYGQPNRAGSGLEIWEGKSYWFISQKAKTRSKTESERENCAVVSDSLQSYGLYSPWNSPGQNTGVGSLSLLQGIFPTQGSNPGLSLVLQVDSLPAEPQGKPKSTGVGSLSLLQRIFLTQELNRTLLHCRWILLQLSYQGSPEARLLRI